MVSAQPSRTIAYGDSPDQVGDLYLPEGGRSPVICLLHGGFWRMAYGRDTIAPIAEDLVDRGFAVWNLEYRRLGGPGGGWPGTFEDVGAGIDHLADLSAGGAIDLDRVTVVGHSAGGHLALWSAQRGNRSSDYQPKRVRIAAAVGLAPVADLALAYELRLSSNAVAEFLGGSPRQVPSRYRATSPIEMLPLGVTQLILHATEDEDVPVEISRRYARAAKAAGDDVAYTELAAADHMDFVNPESDAHDVLCRWLALQSGSQ
jgi:acetyl esterase/lipase